MPRAKHPKLRSHYIVKLGVKRQITLPEELLQFLGLKKYVVFRPVTLKTETENVGNTVKAVIVTALDEANIRRQVEPVLEIIRQYDEQHKDKP